MPDYNVKGNIIATGSVSGRLADIGGQFTNVKASPYNAKGDARTLKVADGALNSTTLTSATAAFTSADIGKYALVPGAGVGGILLATVITAVTNATTATVQTAATVNVTNKVLTIGSDDTAAIQNAFNAVTTAGDLKGNGLFFPTGNYLLVGTNATDTNTHLYASDRHNVQFFGVGRSSVIIGASRDKDIFRVTGGCQGWDWRDITIDRVWNTANGWYDWSGSEAISGGNGIHLFNWSSGGSAKWTFDNVWIRRQYDGFKASNSRAIEHSWSNSRLTHNVNCGANLIMNNEIQFNNCYLTYNAVGLKVGDDAATVDSDGSVFVNGCTVYGNGWGIRIEGTAAFPTYNVFVDGGTIIDQSSTGGVYCNYGIDIRIGGTISWSNGIGLHVKNTKDLKLPHLEVRDCGLQGIFLDGNVNNVTGAGISITSVNRSAASAHGLVIKGAVSDVWLSGFCGNGVNLTNPVAINRQTMTHGISIDATGGTPNDIYLVNWAFDIITPANKFTTVGTVGTNIVHTEVGSNGTTFKNATNNKTIDIGRDNLSQICSTNDYLYLNYGSAVGVDLRSSALHVTATRLVGYNRFDPTYGFDMRGGNMRIQAIATPAAPSLSTSTTGGTLAAGTYTYWLVAEGPSGNKTMVGASAAQITTGATSTVTVTLPATPGASKFYVLRKATAPTAGGTESILVGSVDATGAAGVPFTTLVDTGAALSSFTVPSRNGTADLLVDGQIKMGSTSTANSMLMSDTTGTGTWKIKPYNAASAAQSPAANATTYLTNSNITLVGTPLAVGSTIKWKLYFTKTGAGTAAKSILIKVGTAGTTADATAVTLALPTGTAVIDTGYAEVLFTVRGPLGASAAVVGSTVATHNLQTTGLFTVPNPVVTGTGTINTTTANLIIGLAFTAGASEAWTFAQVTAEAENIYI